MKSGTAWLMSEKRRRRNEPRIKRPALQTPENES
jgi:hypothetical protein